MNRIHVLGILIVFLSGCTSAAPSPTSIPTATVIAENPPACAGANRVYHSKLHEMLLIGCVAASGAESKVSVIWGWNGERWRRVTEGGPLPTVLGGAAYDEQRDVVVVYGGYSFETKKCERETWEWDGHVWAQKAAESPSACDHLQMVYDASINKIVLFGGGDENQHLIAETWSWDGAKWQVIARSEPPGRAHFGYVYDDTHKQILLYGGYTDKILDDFWAWKNDAWQSINFPGPGPLSHFGMALDGNALVLFGGASTASTFSSLSDKTWKLQNGAWSSLNLETHPSKRGSPAMAFDPERKKIVLYGGVESDRKDLRDTWEWDGRQWRCLVNCT